ncbi:MAG: dihydrolipoyl dehydrogenase [candidate division Zixibacteria bacterium]|nr:dihydrolipoyl dehydrogenase [candidate division Zixibacteria bacterium]
MKELYDVVIIGGGPGGYTAAIKCAIKGAKVAVVESDKLGGVCLNRGCIPSKTLIASASLYYKIKHADTFGINIETPPSYDWPAIIERKNRIVKMLVDGVEKLFDSHGVTYVKGHGKVLDRNKVSVSASDGTEIVLETKNIIIATGSRSRNLPGLSIDGKKVLNSDHMFELQKLPKSILIVGAGVIGCEWACMLAMLGVQVTVVEMLKQALPLEDSDSARLIQRELKRLKVKLYTGTTINSLVTESESVRAELSNEKTIETEQIFVAVGRAFNTENLGLGNAGVELNMNGAIKTDNHMRTNIDNIYAIGDVRGEILLAYTAVHDGEIAIDNALGGQAEKNYLGVPSVIFTHPEVGSVGLSETAAEEKYKITVGKFPLRVLGKAHAENEISGEIKIIGDADTDKLLGVHIVGTHATEIIHTAALAIHQEMTVKQLGSLIFGHPTISESLMEAAHDLHGMCVNLPPINTGQAQKK